MKWVIGILFAAALAMLVWRSWPAPEEAGRTTIRYTAWGNPEQLGQRYFIKGIVMTGLKAWEGGAECPST